MLRVELTSKEVGWLISRSQDWLRHGRTSHPHWKCPPHYRRGRAVYYRLDEVLEYAHEHGIELPNVRGRCGVE